MFKFNLLAIRMTTNADSHILLAFFLFTSITKCHLPVMAGTAEEPALIIYIQNICGTGPHGKTYINMAQPAGKPGPMEPVLEDNRGSIGLAGIIVNYDIAEFMGFGPFFLHSEFLGHTETT